jgi:hypothetical protein
MAQIVEVPGIGQVPFPDGMTDAQIAEAISANMPHAVPSGAEALAKETGPIEALSVSAGKKTSDILNGMTQLYLGAKGDTKALGGLATNVAEENKTFAPLQAERPFSTGIGSALPSLAIPGAGSSLFAAGLAGAIPEALSYGTPQERAARGGIGAAGGMAGYGLGSLLGTALKPAGVVVNPNKAAMDAAERIGYKPLAGQATQNPMLLNVENYLARNPGSSGTMQAINRANQEAVNSAALSSIGQSGKEVSGALLNAGEKTIGAEFQRLQAVTAPTLGDDFLNALVNVEASNAAKGSFRNAKIDKAVSKALELAAENNLSGQAYKEIRSELSAQANSAFTSKGGATLGQALKSIRTALDKAAEGSLSPADQLAWKVSREQWGNWKTLTKGLVAEAGDVSPARVAAQLRGQSPAFRTGTLQGPLADVGRIGEGIKGALNPNSGNLLQAGTWGPVTVPANFVAAKLYTSPLLQKYLRNGLLDIGPEGETLLGSLGVPAGIGATKGLLGAQ